jgi:hypothetical protein
MRYVCYSFNLLFLVDKTHCCVAKGNTASIHITRKAPEIVHANLNSCTLGASYCRQNLIRGGVGIFVIKNPKYNYLVDIKYH